MIGAHTIPDSVTTICHSAFCCCSSLTSVSIPASLWGICSEAFAGCTSLTTITLPSTITGMGNDVFDGCTNINIRVKSGSVAYTYCIDNGHRYTIY